MKYLGVEAGRGVAALLVVLAHATKLLASPADFGTGAFGGVFDFASAGVDFFFVLSGFIIHHVHADDIGRPARLRGYAWRRFIRIYPTYWIVLLLYGTLLAISPTRDRYEQDGWAMLANLGLIAQRHDPILGVAWTLQHEIVFYLLFALLLVRASLGRAALAIWGALIVWSMVTGDLAAYPGTMLFGMYNLQFLIGIGVSALLRARGGLPITPPVLVAGGAALFFGTGLVESFTGPYRPGFPPLHLVYAAGAAIALYGAVEGERTGRIGPAPRALVGLGAASYSLYLIHVPVMLVLQQVQRRLPHILPLQREATFLVLVAGAIGAGIVFSRHVERPLLRRCRALARRALPEVHPVSYKSGA